MSFINVSSIQKQIGPSVILQDITFQQQRFQKIAIAGETGSGKSTLLKIIAGLGQADSGEVWMNREKVKGSEETLVPGHADIKYLSQQFELPKFLTVEQVLSYASSVSEREAKKLYAVCRVDHLLQRKTDELSGGEQQRIALARLLSSRPKLVLLDEPYSNLDMVMRGILRSVIEDITSRLKITMLLVSHDPVDTLSWAEEIIVLRAGKIVQRGTPQHLYKEPLDEYTAGLFGSYNLLTPVQLKMFEIRNKRRINRPEDFRIVKRGLKAIPGKVVQTNFLGDRFEIEVKLKGGMIKLIDQRPFSLEMVQEQ